jgi:hypothetical protein
MPVSSLTGSLTYKASCELITDTATATSDQSGGGQKGSMPSSQDVNQLEGKFIPDKVSDALPLYRSKALSVCTFTINCEIKQGSHQDSTELIHQNILGSIS